MKKVISNGNEVCEFTKGSKGFFHYKTIISENESETVVDDSKLFSNGLPVQLIFGSSFKLEVLENAIRTMRIDEIAEFEIDKKDLAQYPFVSKTYRDHFKVTKTYENSHSCGMQQSVHTGYSDLDKLILNPKNLKFIIHLLKVEKPSEYEKEIWQMTDEEMKDAIVMFHSKGNDSFRANETKKAVDYYTRAIAICDKLFLREKPDSLEWRNLQKQKSPILLNYCQCKLKEGEFHEVVSHCSDILKIEPKNTKALFKRAKANKAIWNFEASIDDLRLIQTLDPNCSNAVRTELNDIQRLQKDKDLEDKNMFRKMFLSK